MAKTGVMVCGHGSRDPDAIREFASVAAGIRERLAGCQVESGFLEFARPVIADGLDKLRAAGHDHILAVPGMLLAAGHVKNDIPSVLRAYEQRHPQVRIEYARELTVTPKLLMASAERIGEVLGDGGGKLHDTLLLVVGRGASDPDANANVCKVTRMLWEGMGFGWGETCYSGVTFPLVAPALEHAARLGFRRIVVFPYFLFTGVLIKRIYAAADEAAARHPHLDIIKAPYLADHPLVLDTFAERVREISGGGNRMNCKLCKYREQLPGFTDEVGLPQQSHHHHVEGIGTDGDGGHHHVHNHHHGHDHGHHHPYPHADHPLGPRWRRGR